MDTIAAPLTAQAASLSNSAVSIIRVSGPKTKSCLEKLVPKSERVLGSPRKLVLTDVFDNCGELVETLDRAMVAYFPAPRSFTGEDVAEFHLHGGRFLSSRLLENLAKLGVRIARAGEFSERAFHNGRLDLAQAEAVADLVASETMAQARLANRQLSGDLTRALLELGEPLRDLLAQVEAAIDFPEEDIDPGEMVSWKSEIEQTISTLTRYISSYKQGKLVRDGISVVLTGKPNVGKSSLLNALTDSERAIVSDIAGTTRDSIETHISLGGYKLSLWDTAGLEESERAVDQIEEEGIRRSWKRAEEADLIIHLFDLGAGLEPDEEVLAKIQQLGPPVLIVGNKLDLLAKAPAHGELLLSAKSGQGLEQLKEQIISALELDSVSQAGSLLIANHRHYQCLKQSLASLEQALQATAAKSPPELLAADLRAGLSALEDIIGVTYTEDILGRIFSKFCIGK